MDDWNLLQQYVRDGSTAALDELVRRYLPLVYNVARRQTGNADLAEDVTQAVFLVLMRRARQISKNVLLGGWLVKVTVFTAAKMLRTQRRRQIHEMKAAEQRAETVAHETEPDPAWTSVLFDALATMPRKYRDVVVLRYLQGKSFHDVAQTQNVTENTARQRLLRGLNKLRTELARHGLHSSEEAIGTALMVNGYSAPLAGVTARTISSLHASALANTAPSAASIFLRSIVMAKLKSTALAGLALLLLAGAGGGILYSLHSSPDSPPAPATPSTPITPAVNAGPTAGAAPAMALEDAMKAIFEGNADDLIASFEPLNTEQQGVLRELARGMASEAALRTAMAKQFGPQQSNNVMQALGLDPPPQLDVLITTLVPVVNGDHAQLVLPHFATVNCVKIDGAWKLQADTIKELNFFSQITAVASQLDRITKDIDDRKFADITQVRTVLSKILRDAHDPDPIPGPDRPAVLAPGATPQETVAAIYWAMVTGNADAAVSCMQNLSPDEETAMRLRTAIYASAEQLRQAVAEKFGNRAARNTILTLGLDTGIHKKLLDDSPKIDGDKAQVDLRKTIGIVLNLSKSNGVWKIEHDYIGPPYLPWRNRMQEYYIPKFQQMAAEVNSGKYRKFADLLAAAKGLSQELKADNKRFRAEAAGTQPQR